MDRRNFLKRSTQSVAGPLVVAGSATLVTAAHASDKHQDSVSKPKDYKQEPFQRMVILGESTVQGGEWLVEGEVRFADVLAELINSCQEKPMEYFNKGIGGNSISTRSPGYPRSAKPSAMERYKKDVIELKPDLYIHSYGLNDMRAAMPIDDFREDMSKIIGDVKDACDPMIVLTTIYYMTGWKSYPPHDKGSVELTLEYNDCIRELADQFDCVLADFWEAEGYADWLIHYDGVHANRVGNLVLAHRLFEAIATHASCLTITTMEKGRETGWTKRTADERAVTGDHWVKTW